MQGTNCLNPCTSGVKQQLKLIFQCIDLKAQSWNSCFAFELTDSFELFHKPAMPLKDGFSTVSSEPKRTLGWGVKRKKKKGEINTLYKVTTANELV